jgi:hypothetical protein
MVAGTTTAWFIHPALAALYTATGITATAVIIMTALFGPERLSERAFRFLRWIADRPEPPQQSR